MSRKAKILVIEDDPDTAEATRLTLETRAYEVLLVADAEEGVRRAASEHPDLIILDVMFGSDERTRGFDVALKLKGQRDIARIPILMVTAVNVRHPSFHFHPESDGEHLPVDAFIDKPAQPTELLAKVEELLEQGTSRWASWPQPALPPGNPGGR
jgi:DNA-binding response OmpR family regulator